MDGAGCEIIDGKAAFAQVILDRFFSPTNAESDLLDRFAHGAQSHGGGNAVGVGDERRDIHPQVMVLVGVSKDADFADGCDDIGAAQVGVIALFVTAIDSQWLMSRNLKDVCPE